MSKGLLRQALQRWQSRNFNIDNGAGVTIDDAFMLSLKPVNIQKAYVLYTTETAGTVAGANIALGTTVAGVDVIAATAYTNSATVGTTTALALLKTRIPAGQFLSVRHTGIASAALGEAYLVIEFSVDE